MNLDEFAASALNGLLQKNYYKLDSEESIEALTDMAWNLAAKMIMKKDNWTMAAESLIKSVETFCHEIEKDKWIEENGDPADYLERIYGNRK